MASGARPGRGARSDAAWTGPWLVAAALLLALPPSLAPVWAQPAPPAVEGEVEGEVLVDNEVASMDDSMVMSVIGPGSLIGEMGVLDGAPRSASCTATSDLAVAVLSREALLTLIKSNPAVAARLMLAISKRLSDRLREANRKIRTLGGLSRALQQELNAAHQIKSGVIFDR